MLGVRLWEFAFTAVTVPWRATLFHMHVFSTAVSRLLIGLSFVAGFVSLQGPSASPSIQTQVAPLRSLSAQLSESTTSVVRSLLVATSSVSDLSAPDDSGTLEYSWQANASTPELSKLRDELLMCISHSTNPRECDTLSSCTTTLEQCSYSEAVAWDEIGNAAYMELLASGKAHSALLISQAAWKLFARAECDLVDSLFFDDPIFRREEVSRCAVRLSSERALTLRAYLENVKHL